MYGVDQSVQTIVFLKSIGVGFIIGLIYNIFMSIRVISRKKAKISVLIQDILFSLIAAIITFVFAFESNYGIIRFYMLAGESMGFCIFYMLPGNIINKFIKIINDKVKNISNKIFNRLKLSLQEHKKRRLSKKSLKKHKIYKKRSKNILKSFINLLHKKG